MAQKRAMIKSVVVYCASSTKIDECYFEAAKRLGEILAKNKIVCYNGGGGIGLMGAISDAILENGGQVVGVIPQFMCEMGWQHHNLTDLLVVKTMHERKKTMLDKAEAVVVLAGGLGTLEEFFEALTWKQLGLIDKPIVLLNTNHFFDDIVAFTQKAVDEQFMRPLHKKMWSTVNSPDEVLPAIEDAEKWDTSYRKTAAI